MLMHRQKVLADFDGGKQLVRQWRGELARLFMLACLLQVGTFRGAVNRDLTLFAAALSADVIVQGETEALFLAKMANGTAQTAPR